MFRKLLRGKIHRATVTGGDLSYEGSITVDEELMKAAGLVTNEAVDIYNVTNGNRFETYVIPGPAGSGIIQINGAACHLADTRDIIIIAHYGYFSEHEVTRHHPRIVLVNSRNQIKQISPSKREVTAQGIPDWKITR